MNPTLIFEQAQRNAVHGSIAPPLVEEAAGAIQVLKVIAILLAAPEAQIADLEVGPEVARRVAVGLALVVRAVRAVLEPLPRAVAVHVRRVVLQELERLGPQRRHALGAVVDVDVEPVRLVVVLHPPEHVVVDVAEEAHLGLHPPVVLDVGQRRVLGEEAAVPAAHLVVRGFFHVLYLLRAEERDGFVVEVHVDP